MRPRSKDGVGMVLSIPVSLCFIGGFEFKVALGFGMTIFHISCVD